MDSNVPMYVVGGSHPRKAETLRIMEKLIAERQRLVTDAEVLQEILHRYVSIDRRDAIQPAFDSLLGLTEEVFPVDKSAVTRAKQLVLEYRRISARDAVHLAVMEQHHVETIFSFDMGFDAIPGVVRLR